MKVDAKTLSEQKKIAKDLFDEYTFAEANKGLITNQTLNDSKFIFDKVEFKDLSEIERQFEKYKKRLNQIKSRRMPLLFGLDKRNADLFKIQTF